MRYLRNNFTVYHHNDPDGYFGAVMCRELIDSLFIVGNGRTIENPITVKYKELNYPKVFPIEAMDKGDIVFIVDVSFGENSFKQLKQVCEKAEKVYWIDHHATSLNEVVPILEKDPIENLEYYVDTKYCGALNTYICLITEYFNKFNDNINKSRYREAIKTLCERPIYRSINGDGLSFDDPEFHDKRISKLEGFFELEFKIETGHCNFYVPTFLILLDDYDCFKEKIEDSNYFVYGIRNDDLSYYFYLMKKYKTMYRMHMADHENATCYDAQKDFTSSYVGGLIQKGQIIVEYLKQDYADNICNAFVFDFTKYGGPEKTICLNARGNSWVFSDLYEEYDMCCMFHYDKDCWKYSLYANKEAIAKGIDCSKVAAKIDKNGGGHPGASGCSTEELIFNKK